ncbi:MAG: hypothetical protein K6F32_07910 [Bacilli bacterium]|nr:hypothetical protein [Bacilli bacterium]
MNADVKKALKIGLILASIGGVSALVVSSVNLFTAPMIAKNKAEKEASALKEIFPDATKVEEAVELKSGSLLKYWPVSLPNEEARIYSCSGKNGYGAVSLLIGVYSDFSLGRMSIIENTETYGSTLNQNYIAPYQYYETAEQREAALNNVTCGATYGAKLIKGMVLEAVAHYKEA